MVKYNIVFLIIYFGCSIQLLFSQDYKSLFKEKYNISKDTALEFCDSLLKTNTPPKVKAFALYSKSSIYSRLGNYNEAERFINKSFIEIKKIEIKKVRNENKLQALYYQALHLLTLQNTDKASITITEGLELAKKTQNALLLIKFKSLIGRSFSLLGVDKKAIENGNETINDIIELKNSLNESEYQNELLRTYLNTANRNLNFFLRDSISNKTYLDSTYNYLLSINKFITENKIEINQNQKRRIFNLDADILFYKGNYTHAIDKYFNVLRLVKNEKIKKREYQVKFKIAEAYFLLGAYEKSLTLFNELNKADLKQYKLLKNSVIIKYYYAQIYLKAGDNKKALKYTDTFNHQIGGYYKTMSNQKINAITSNELRIKKDILNDLMLQKKANVNLTSYIIIIIVSVIVGFIGIIIYIKYQKNIAKEKINNLNTYIKTLKEKDTKEITEKIAEDKAEIILAKLKTIEAENLFISTNYTLNNIAKKIDSNSAYVSHVVNTYWGKSFTQYTNELRINYALLKLENDIQFRKYTLDAIAESVGYKSLSTFNKHFKTITGVTSKQYVKHLNSNS